jgi:hypothetical protein
MNLIDSLRRWILDHLPYGETDADIVNALNEMNAHGLLVIYHNWISRLVQPIPRRVEKSVKFAESLHRVTFADALAAIEQDVRAGKDLTKYLSTSVKVAFTLPTRHRRGPHHLDMLLNDWGVHHLHLSTEMRSDGFVKRTGPLLFARFVRDTAYFLDIADHGEWTKESVANTLVIQFPDAGGVNVVNGVIGVSLEIDDDEHRRLRAANINTIRMCGNKAIIGGGFNTNGLTIMAVRAADNLLEKIEQFEASWRQDEPAARADWEARCGPLPEKPLFEFTFSERGPAIVEARTDTRLLLV